MTSAAPSSALETLEQHFGFNRFMPDQEAVISRLLDGKSCVAIFPTGAGKSLCYQLPALMLDGLTLVVSPLIALMKDQLDFLSSRNIPAARMDSSLTLEESRDVYNKLRQGQLKILYLAPERLANERFLATLGQQKISLLAVDEAHCISEWGHNFRPEYLKLARLAEKLRVVRVLALTATATPVVGEQIAKAFSIKPDDVVRTAFHRPNLHLRITACDPLQRGRTLVNKVKTSEKGPTIVYVTLQKTAEQIAAYLSKAGFSARAYHAGMDNDDRRVVQDDFMASDEGIVVATIAFGMGIDKRNIRYVYHYNLPKSLENYAQEIGRAGRDGADSICEMLACVEDRITLENFTFGDTPEPESVPGLIDELLSLGEQFDISVYDLSFKHDIRILVVETILTYLQLLNIIESVGSFYTEYKFKTSKPLNSIIGQFDAGRGAFLKAIFAASRQGKTWYTIDTHAAAERLNEPRERIIKALGFLADQGDIELQGTGVRQSFRRTPTEVDRDQLIDKISKRFQTREQRDIERLDQLMAFISSPKCASRNLAAYFGDELPADCGNCGACVGEPAAIMRRASEQALSTQQTDLIDAVIGEAPEALASPRRLTRFLCGITSPRLSRAKLSSHPAFGCCSDLPFQNVLKLINARNF